MRGDGCSQSFLYLIHDFYIMLFRLHSTSSPAKRVDAIRMFEWNEVDSSSVAKVHITSSLRAVMMTVAIDDDQPTRSLVEMDA